jgi:hypothetical protein
MLKHRVLEIVFWSFLSFYLTAMVFIFSSEQPYKSCQQQSCTNDQAKRYEVENEPFWQKIFPDPISFFNFSLVLVTGCLVGIGIIQANAGKQSADSLRNIERAYVFIDYELLRVRNAALKIGGISPRKQIELVFKNFGRTPAVVNGINCKCFHWPNRYLPEIEAVSIKFPSGIAIGSSSPWSVPAIFDGTQRDINDAMSGAGSIYLYGKVAYLDMLGEQRETGFCCEWSFAEGQFFMAPNTKLNYHT